MTCFADFDVLLFSSCFCLLLGVLAIKYFETFFEK